ncbi:unnamed protein product [Clonostachys chloroleuca]|uniref:Major facilitator superfamily (MFS) profile domain-containing protein n=1 Tax=Clonostachys chloroleuca TaxID=1926264 RepID=A0AA35Q224_9HYPO|nr:unnamed protein product [Clonostachys chloroleuca]
MISGIAIGALSVGSPITLSEIAPSEGRGLLSSWFVVALGAGLVGGVFCAYGAYLNMPAVQLQYQVGLGGDETRSIFLRGMYGVSKLGFTLIASFFFVELLGRRKSLFIGITAQLLSQIYIGVFIKVHQDGSTNEHASQAATAALFIHAFGYAVGRINDPIYVFGSELWPNRIRSFGAALSQTFHWLFIYGVKFSIPSLLKATNNWGAFIFFAGWCALALGHVYVMVPETSIMARIQWKKKCMNGSLSTQNRTPSTQMIDPQQFLALLGYRMKLSVIFGRFCSVRVRV